MNGRVVGSILQIIQEKHEEMEGIVLSFIVKQCLFHTLDITPHFNEISSKYIQLLLLLFLTFLAGKVKIWLFVTSQIFNQFYHF